jgi:hypothetical protein
MHGSDRVLGKEEVDRPLKLGRQQEGVEVLPGMLLRLEVGLSCATKRP